MTIQPPHRRLLLRLGAALLTLAAWTLPPAHAADEAPDALIGRLSTEVLEIIRTDEAVRDGDVERIVAVVDEKIMPHVNFTRMTASATGPAWRRATPEQRQRLQDEFKALLVRTYAGALKQVGDQRVEMLPLRAAADDKELVVRSLVRGKGEPVQLDYRMEATPGEGSGWKVYDLNVLGVWLVQNYRSQFAQQINQGGIEGLIDTLARRNQGATTAGHGS